MQIYLSKCAERLPHPHQEHPTKLALANAVEGGLRGGGAIFLETVV